MHQEIPAISDAIFQSPSAASAEEGQKEAAKDNSIDAEPENPVEEVLEENVQFAMESDKEPLTNESGIDENACKDSGLQAGCV